MKIFLICSKNFYGFLPEIKSELERRGHIITLPNCHNAPTTESKYRELGYEVHSAWKAGKIKHSTNVIAKQDAVFVLNFEKNGIKNYIGGATFLEMYDAFRLGKKIYLFNGIPDGILRDEIVGFNPIIVGTNLNSI